MKRVLCIVSGMNAGGAETFLMKVYRKLDKKKYQIDFAVGIEGVGFYDSEIKELGGKIFHIPPKSTGIFASLKAIKDLVKSERYKYVLRTSAHSLSALELLAAKMGGAEVCVFRSSNTNTNAPGGKYLLLHKLFSFLPKIVPNVKFAPSTEAAEYMFGKGCIARKKASLIHNGVDLNIFCKNEEWREEIRSEFELGNKLVVGHIGRFSIQKNHDYLIDIFHSLSKDRDDAVLVLVGEGELKESVKRKVEKLGIGNKVLFTGIRSDVSKLLNAFDILLLPSLFEGMPNIVIEAQAVGLNCLVSNTITREANITGRVHYLPITEDYINWKNMILKSNFTKIDTHDCLCDYKYDIDSVVEDFITALQLRGES